MCGIAGWYDKNKDLGSQEKTIKNMSNTMMRRGPDDDGIYLNNPVCLIHRRLAVIDVENAPVPLLITVSYIIHPNYAANYFHTATHSVHKAILKLSLHHL